MLGCFKRSLHEQGCSLLNGTHKMTTYPPRGYPRTLTVTMNSHNFVHDITSPELVIQIKCLQSISNNSVCYKTMPISM